MRGFRSLANAASPSAPAEADDVALNDDSRVHNAGVAFDKAAYEQLVAAYVSSQDRDWVEATGTIDGMTVEKAGIRLKGNSSPHEASTSGTTQPQSPSRLIRSDKCVDGQHHQGHTDIVIRGNSSRTSPNEAVALELIDLAGRS